MWVILESTRVWENCVFSVLSLSRVRLGPRLWRWRNVKVEGKKEQKSRSKYSISILFFVSYIYIFSFFHLILSPYFFLFLSLFFMSGCSNLLSCILLKRPQLGEPITVFTVLQPARLMSNTTWTDLRNVLDSHRSSVLSACSIDSAGLLSVEECAAPHTSQIHGLYFNFAGRFS